jgi:MFS family permease
MFIYIGGYQIGFGPIAWLLISEVFPLEVRGQAVAVAVQTNFFWNVITSYLFPIATSAIGPPSFSLSLLLSLTPSLSLPGASKTFGIFAVIDALALYFVFKFVPETKGLSLEDIEILLGSRVSPALRTLSKAGEGENGHSVTSPLLRSGERYHTDA